MNFNKRKVHDKGKVDRGNREEWTKVYLSKESGAPMLLVVASPKWRKLHGRLEGVNLTIKREMQTHSLLIFEWQIINSL